MNLTFSGFFNISNAESFLLGLKPVPVYLKKRKKYFPLKGISKSSINHSVGFTTSKISLSLGKGKPKPSKEPSIGTVKTKPLWEILKISLIVFFQLLQCIAKFETTQSTELFFKGIISILQIKARRGAAGLSFKEDKDRSHTKTFLLIFNNSSVKRPTPAPISSTEPFLKYSPKFSINI